VVEDYQNLRFLGDRLERDGFKSIYLAPENFIWDDFSIGNTTPNNKVNNADIVNNAYGIFRFVPMEYLKHIANKKRAGSIFLKNFFNTAIPSCNHPIALLAQSKRIPLIWDKLGTKVDTWKRMLPETIDPLRVTKDEGFIFKPAFGWAGADINIPGTVSGEEDKAIISAAAKKPDQWVAQRMFISKKYSDKHICIGVFVIDGDFAGFYGRVSEKPRIDADSSDVPVLVQDGV
jgi:glutathionylspermidine synthase